MKRGIVKGIISVLITLGMLCQSIPVCVMGADAVSADNSIGDSSWGSSACDSDNSSDSSGRLDENLGNETEYVLTEEEIELKQNLENDILSLNDSTAGEDYIDDELVGLCDTYEDAIAVAEAYSSLTDAKLVLDSFELGVAVYKIENISEMSVEEVLKIAADENNNLPPLSANTYDELCSVDTGNETFTDPLTKSTSQYYQYYHELIGSKYVWEALDDGSAKTTSGRSLSQALSESVVAVIDTGVNPDHYDLYATDPETGATESILVGGRAFVSGIADNDWSDGNGHGSHVAGIVAAVANTTCGRGVAAGVKIMPLRTFNSSGTGGKAADNARAVRYASASRMKYDGIDPGTGYEDVPAYNVTVLNMSLGSTTYNSVYVEALKMAEAAGIVICAASGNYGFSGYFYPAAYDSAISVSSVNSDYERSFFSDYGDWVDISAPGGDSRYDSRFSDNDYKRDEYIYSLSNTGTSGVVPKRGTSMATPVVSAAAAIVEAKYENSTPAFVKNRLLETAKKVNGNGLGAGCVDVAASIGIIENAGSVSADVPNGSTVENASVIRLSTDNPAASIYYTLNGKTPDPDNMSATGTVRYDDGDADTYPVINGGSGTKPVTLKAVAVLYGNVSDTASYSYYVDTKAVKAITITSDNNNHYVTVGKRLTLKASVAPATADNKKIIWSSSDSSIATVSATGIVTVNAAGNSATPVVITAKADDGYGAIATYDIYVLPTAEKIEILPPASNIRMYDPDTIMLSAGQPQIDLEDNTIAPDIYDMSYESGLIKVWPENASQKVTYKSSNPAVASVTTDGKVTAHSTGSVTVTVTAQDGSGIYDIQKFRVISPVYAIDICDSNTTITKDTLIAGAALTPKVTFNNGETVPSDTKLVWTLKYPADEGVVSINASTGRVSAKSNVFVTGSRDITIVATSEKYGVTGQYTFKLYRRHEKIQLNDRGTYFTYSEEDNICEISNPSRVYLYELLSAAEEYGTLPMYSMSSSNENVVLVYNNDTNYKKTPMAYLRAVSEGTSFITLKTLDGTNLTYSFRVKVKPYTTTSSVKLSIKNVSGGTIYYPGKRLVFDLESTQGMPVSDAEWCFVNPETMTEYKEKRVDGDNEYYVYENAYPYLSIKDGVVTANKVTGLVPDKTETVLLYAEGKVNNKKYSALASITLYPYITRSIQVYDEDNAQISSLTFNRVGQSKKLYPKSLPETACQSGYKYSVSNSSVIRVLEDGTVEALHNGIANVYVTAGDGSGRRTTVRVTVAQDKVQSIVLSDNEIKLSVIPMGELTSGGVLSVTGIYPATAGTKVSASSTNTRVATVTSAGIDALTGLPKFYVKAVGKGTAFIKIKAEDGSGKYAQCKVTVEKPVTDIKIASATGTYILKPSRGLTLRATVNSDATNKKVSWFFTDEETMSRYATLDSIAGRVTAKGDDVIGLDEHEVKIYAKALDAGEKTSSVVTVVISPSKVLMKNVQVKSYSGLYDLSYGSRMLMQATTTADATNRKIVWSVYDKSTGNESSICNITATGLLRTVSEPSIKTVVTVRATAVDGSGVYGEKDVTISPKAKRIVIDSDPATAGSGVHNLQVGSDMVLNIISEDAAGTNESCNKFLITYSTGYGKVYLNNSDGTSVTVRGLKPGNMYVYAQLKDGSAKKEKYIIHIY